MTRTEKITYISTILGETDSSLLGTYLDYAEKAIISQLYSMSKIPQNATMPSKYDQIQCEAVVSGYSVRGGEYETSHREGEVTRTFQYSSMMEYIRNNVIPYAGL